MCKIILNNGKILLFFCLALWRRLIVNGCCQVQLCFNINIKKYVQIYLAPLLIQFFFSFRQRIPSHLYPVSSWLGCDSPYIMPLLTNSVLQCSALCVMYSNKLILNVCFGTIQLIIYAYEMWSIKILKNWDQAFL